MHSRRNPQEKKTGRDTGHDLTAMFELCRSWNCASYVRPPRRRVCSVRRSRSEKHLVHMTAHLRLGLEKKAGLH